MCRIFTGIIVGVIAFLLFLLEIVSLDALVIVLAIGIFSVASGADSYFKK